MDVDHLFIFSTNNGIDADELVQFGLSEGSSRRHLGQGTVNRKFYFDNFFLEILWVVDEEEIKTSPVREIGLWERSIFRSSKHSRFGMCLVNNASSDALFKKAALYQPQYFPAGMPIEYLPNSIGPQLPYTFRLPFREAVSLKEEPRVHKNGLKRLTKVEFGFQTLPENAPYLHAFQQEKSIQFRQKEQLNMLLEFDFGQQQKKIDFTALDLVIKY